MNDIVMRGFEQPIRVMVTANQGRGPGSGVLVTVEYADSFHVIDTEVRDGDLVVTEDVVHG